ncbi:MAG TPA: hypothetical protein VGL83_05650 [Stellaceae bacterium]|jgi:hypothetical protein
MTRAEAFRRYRLAGLVCLLAGGGATAIGAALYPAAFFAAWLAAFCYWLGLPLGALALLMIHNLTGGHWIAIARAPLEAATATMPLFILAFLPLLAGLHDLYSWTRPLAAPLPNQWYLNLDFFGLRAAIYFIVWNFFAYWQLRPAPDAARSQVLSGIGLILLGCAATWASFDWIMSIEPQWFSSIFGMMVGAGQFIVALAFVLVAILSADGGEIEDAAFRRHLANLATILLAVDIFWAYTAYSQWLIIWEENLSSEIPWYIERLGTFWRAVVLAIILLDLLVPLFVLVWTPAKRSRALVRAVSAVLLFGGMMQMWWLVLPPFHDAALAWLAPAAMIALGGLWLWLFFWRLERGRWLPAAATSHPMEAKP